MSKYPGETCQRRIAQSISCQSPPLLFFDATPLAVDLSSAPVEELPRCASYILERHDLSSRPYSAGFSIVVSPVRRDLVGGLRDDKFESALGCNWHQRSKGGCCI